MALNRAVAVAELDGPEVALAEVDRLALTTYHPWHATRADLLRRLGRSAEAGAAYDAAIAVTDNAAERAYLTRRRDQLALKRNHLSGSSTIVSMQNGEVPHPAAPVGANEPPRQR